MTTDILIAITIGMSFVVVISVLVVLDLRKQEQMNDSARENAHTSKTSD
jgi:hypothetical protein